ncbi:MAG: TolC family protein [Candidatus Goldbacteria bacterium]|nr:TolC family protein [Candidatus Goldiibacteriota bacterium]
MKKVCFFILLTVFSYVSAGADCLPVIDKIIKNSPAVKKADENLNRQKMLSLASLGEMLPNISLRHNRYFLAAENGIEENGWDTYLNGRMVLFSGLSRINYYLAGTSLEASFEKNAEYSVILAAEEAISVYFEGASLSMETADYAESYTLMEKRLKELKRRETIGKSRKSETASAEVRYYSLKAQLIQYENNLQKVTDEISLMAGEAQEEFVLPECVNAEILDFDIDSAVENNPLILSQKEKVNYAQRVAWAQAGSFLPVVSVSASHKLGEDNYRYTGPSVSLFAEWSLFEGGARIAQTAAAAAAAKAAEQDYEDSKRFMKLKISGLYNDYKASLKRKEILKLAYEAAEKSAKAQESDYYLGNVSNLEVLQSMMDVTDSKRAYDRESAMLLKYAMLLKLYTPETKGTK